MRTLSKAYALAGARLGYLVAPDAVVDGLLAVRQPYSVSRFDQTAAEVVLEMRGCLEPLVDALVENRAVLASALERMASDLRARAGVPALAVYPSQANFLLVRLASDVEGVPSADAVHEALAGDFSILVRNFSHTPGLAGCLRLTVGTPQENERLVAALRSILGLAPDPATEGERK